VPGSVVAVPAEQIIACRGLPAQEADELPGGLNASIRLGHDCDRKIVRFSAAALFRNVSIRPARDAQRFSQCFSH
jgi:hypothetical protein